MSMVSKLVCDVILGDEFMKNILQLSSSSEEKSHLLFYLDWLQLTWPYLQRSSNYPQTLFLLLPNHDVFSPEEKNFINEEVQRLLKADIITPSRSPWRA